MFFSFALIAGMMTIINVGVNESGGLSSVKNAQASLPPDGGGISLVDGTGSKPISITSGGCSVGCGPSTGSGYGSSTGGGGGPFLPPPTNVKNVFYDCSSMSASGVCGVNGVVSRDARIVWYTTQCKLSIWNTVVAYGGDNAVQWLRDNSVGGIWNPWADPEKVYSYLTGYDLGWFPYPVSWSAAAGYNYRGVLGNYPTDTLNWECYPVEHVTPAYKTKNVTCAVLGDGRAFPYSVGYSVTYTNVNDSGGKGFDWRISSETCVYVSRNTPPPTVLAKTVRCYWNIGYTGHYSTNRAAIQSGGTSTTNPPVNLDAFASQPTISGNDSTSALNNCTTNLSMKASLSLRDGYAYYRLTGVANYQDYQFYNWDTAYTGGRVLHAKIVPTGVFTRTANVYGTFTCQNNPPYRQYPSWGSLPNITFSYAGCGQDTTWSCLIPNAPQINNTSNAVELMRDGNYIPLNLQGVSVQGNGIRDSNTGQVGTVADGNMSYKVQVVNGSSPFYGTNANEPKQYFKLWNPSKSNNLSWDTWNSNPNANKNVFLNYYWSSDTGKTWQMNYQAKINTAQFAVPWQDSSTSAPYTKWMTDNNISCGTKNSNQATILRSVSSK